MKNQIFTILVLLTVLTSGCISGYFTDEPENEFIGCTDGGEVDHNGTEESCSIEEVQDVVNETNTTNTTNNSTTALDDNNTEVDPGEGVEENQTILNFNALIHNYGESDWSDFQLHSMFDYGWNNTTNSTSKWTVIFFLSTDCGHCWNAADEISNWSQSYSNHTNFLAIAVNFSSNNNFNATQEEVVAFQQQTNYTGCVGGNYNCADRPGEPHEFGYVDDRNQTIMRDWGVGGTPAFFIIQPNGVVAWNQYQHNNGDGENIEQALQRFFGE